MGPTINKLHGAHVYVNNRSNFGKSTQVVLPQIEAVMNEYAALGMSGAVELPSGFGLMEATITWNYPDNETQADFSNPFRAVNVTVRSSKSTWSSGGLEEEKSVIAHLRGLPKQHGGGTFSGKDDVEVESVLAVNYYKLIVDGEDVLEFEPLTNKYVVRGVDIFAQRRANLGLS